MFSVKIREEEYKVKFDHCRYHSTYSFRGEGTFCKITNSRNLQISASRTVLHENDNYDKNFGRKLSLARALKNGGFNTKERTLFWEAYFKTRGKVN